MTTGVHVNYGQVTKGSDSPSAHQRMEINSRYSHLSRADLAGAGYITTATAFLGASERSSSDVLVATASVGAGSPGGTSPSAGSPGSNGRSGTSVGGTVAAATAPATLLINPMLQEHHLQFQHQMQQLRRQQQLQQELLIQQFQQQQQQLSEHYAKQMQASLEYLEQQKKLEEQKQERERHERERLESLKKKEKHEQSAVASSEVKQRLQEFVLNKKQREAAAAAANSANNSPPNFRNWSRQHQSLDQACPPSSASGSPGTSSSLTQSGISSRYRQVLLGKYDDDFPLRKTASEPNLKVRSVLKQKVIERRSSPLLRRKDRPGGPLPNKRRPALAMEGSSSGSSKPDSGPGSPPNGTNCPSSVHSSNGSTPIQEEPCTSPYQMGEAGSLSDLTLYSSPSMPNISLGRPPIHGGGAITVDGKGGGGVIHQPSEAQLRAIATVRLGMPLTSHILHPASVSYYPSLPEGEFTPPTSPSYVPQMKSVDQSSRIGGSVGGQGPVMPGIYPTGTMLTDVQVAQARLHRYNSRSLRNIHRPLGRTQSAPLPLGHPMLNQSSSAAVAAQQGILLSAQQSEHYLREKQLYKQQQQQQHHLLKQHIRQTVLTRANSKNQVENVEEETEAAVAQEMKEALSPEATSAPPAQSSSPTASSSHHHEIIDLTELRGQADKRSASSAAIGGTDSEVDWQQKEREAFLQQQRDLMSRHTLQISEGSAFTPRHHHHHGARPLSRALSSPLVALNPTGSVSPQETSPAVRHTFTTGLVYDSLMLKHQCICGDNSYHPEHSGRLQSVWARLQETGLVSRCERVRSRKATLEEIQSCHSEAYTLLFGTNPLNRQKLDLTKLGELPIKNFTMLPCGGIGVDLDTTWNDLHTASAARMAAGCVTELAFKVATGEVKNGFAVVRPPGHHAEHQQAMGFCFFNSVAIAAKQLLQRVKLEKILIVDWDVHHGNGLQQMFYDNPRVLYISLHRHDDGNFFPGTGDPQEVGVDDGSGFNVNIAWSDSLNPPMGDSEYMAAFRCLVMPIAKDFDPDIVLVAAGFDSAAGHPPQLGGYTITPACFGYMTKQLMQIAKGKVVLALEGGYDLPAVCDCSQECVAVLLGDEGTPMKETEISRKPSANAIESLQRIISIQAHHWPVIRRWAHTIQFSHLEAQQKENEEVETVTALASLSVAVHPTSAAHLQRSKSQSLEDTPEEEPMEQDQEIK